MGIFGLVMFVIGAVMKSVTLLVRTCVSLYQQGFLIPMIVAGIGILFAQTLDGWLATLVYIISGIAGSLVWFFFFRKENSNPFADMMLRLKTPRTEKMCSRQSSGVVFGRQGRRYITKAEDVDGHVLVVGGVGWEAGKVHALLSLRLGRGGMPFSLSTSRANFTSKARIFVQI